MPHPAFEHAARAKHDLGKYVAFQARWLGDDASADQLLEALRQDVRATRRSDAETLAAPELWARLRAPLATELSSADLAPIDAAVARLAAAGPGLDAGDLSLSELRHVAEDARVVARELAVLTRRLRDA